MKTSEIEDVVVDFIKTMQDLDFDTYEYIKITLLSYETVRFGSEVVDFLHKAFDYVESRRPLLIGVKGDVCNAAN